MRTNGLSILAVLSLLAVAAGCQTQQTQKDKLAQKWQKTSAPAKLASAEAMLERGQLEQADKVLQEIMAAPTADAAAYALRGRLNALRGQMDAADADFAAALERDATLDKVWFYRAALAAGKADWPAAIEFYANAVSLKPDTLEYRRGLSEAYLAAGQPSDAMNTMRQAVERSKTDATALAAAADIFSRCGQMDQAVEWYEKCALLEPANAAYLEALAYAYAGQKRWDKAADAFNRLLNSSQQAGGKQAILEMLAMCAMNAQRYGLAVSCYDQLLVQRRADAEMWLGLANAALGAKLYDRAQTAAQKALQYRPAWPQAVAALGAALYLQKQYDAALAQFSQLRNDDQLSGFGWFMAGQCWQKMGQAAKAQAAFKQAAEQPASGLLVERFLKTPADAL